ncbi:glycosyltransferase family 2 protein [Pseudalkalibacillus salsuginis]|uniref:glycosyltransferase family 2 protein n=1 Tax=Pseudalkalibacillus salsuginis TaxID=2910972 RepID=UPI001F2BC49E|nr:glycosyltransferase family A protein [Pseudalkalibacillus salsuginis]MCF6409164.1 glycosyltransferase family 2 protein [Pseudalkalibacillus salsuginis]
MLACTNKEYSLPMILENYYRQTWKEKELIIILNKDSLSLEDWKLKVADDPEIKVLQLKENTSLGECLNRGVEEAAYDYISKFDDDDFYTGDYLAHSMETLRKSKAKVVGKTTIYMYFEDDRTLYAFNPYKFARQEDQETENRYDPKVMMGGTLLFEKSVNRLAPFQPCNTGEDAKFCEGCIEKGIPIFSGTKDHYVYIRNSLEAHTWKIKNQKLKRFCTPIIKTDDFRSYLENLKAGN